MNVILFIAAIVISIILFRWLTEILKDTAQTVVAIAVIVVLLLLLFGIQPGAIWQQIQQFWQGLWNLLLAASVTR